MNAHAFQGVRAVEPSLRVLLVDGDGTLPAAVIDHLERQGLEVTRVPTAHMAWQRCLDQNFDVIVLDRHGVRVDQIVQSSLRQLKVRGTPTAIVVSRRGVIERIMPGRLDDAQQEDLVSFLKAGF